MCFGLAVTELVNPFATVPRSEASLARDIRNTDRGISRADTPSVELRIAEPLGPARALQMRGDSGSRPKSARPAARH